MRSGIVRVAIMQPYFLPYLGYFQLINAVDIFVVYDNIKYTKKGWINRNRYLMNGAPSTFSIPLKKAPDSLQVQDRFIADEFDRAGLLARFHQAYRKAPFYASAFERVAATVTHPASNLFDFLHNSIVEVCEYLNIRTKIVVASQIETDHSLKSQDKVVALCKKVGGAVYINPIGGRELYHRDAFMAHGIDLKFLQPRPVKYEQLGDAFVPWLSIVDVMMFNSSQSCSELLTEYELIPG